MRLKYALIIAPALMFASMAIYGADLCVTYGEKLKDLAGDKKAEIRLLKREDSLKDVGCSATSLATQRNVTLAYGRRDDPASVVEKEDSNYRSAFAATTSPEPTLGAKAFLLIAMQNGYLVYYGHNERVIANLSISIGGLSKRGFTQHETETAKELLRTLLAQPQLP